MSQEPRFSAVDEIQLERWSEFEGAIQNFTGESATGQSEVIGRRHAPLFRGLGDSCWGLETTLERSYPRERGLEKLLCPSPARGSHGENHLK